MLNHIFKTKFDVATGLCYAVSELGKNHVSRNAKVASAVVIGALSVVSGNAEAASCTLGANNIINTDVSCEVDTSQEVKAILVKKSAAVTSAGLTLNASPANSYSQYSEGALKTTRTATLTINGDTTVNIEPTTKREYHAVHAIDNSVITINGNLETKAAGRDHRALFAQGDGTININGNFTANTSANGFDGGGADIQVDGAAKVNITGDVKLSTKSLIADKGRSSLNQGGTLTVGGNVTINQNLEGNISGFGAADLSVGASEFAKNLSVYSNAEYAVALQGGVHNVRENLTIQTANFDGETQAVARKIGLYIEDGELHVSGKADISTKDDFTEDTVTPYAIRANTGSGSPVVFATGSFANSADAAAENFVTKILLDKGTTVMTSGEGAAAVKLDVTNATAKLVNRGDITGKNSDAIDASGSESVTVINESNIIAKENTGHVFLGSGGDDSFTSSAGVLGGKIAMAGGNDELILSGTDISKVVSIDGGKGDGSLQDGEQNTFVLNQNLTGSTTSAGEPNNAKISNWTTINVAKDKEATLTLTGDLLSGKANDGVGDMTIGAQGKLELAPNTATSTVGYNVVNEGKIDLVKGTAADNPTAKMTIKGNYEGKDGSQLIVKSIWNNPDVQKNDLLVIDGNATGNTVVKISNKILGDVTAAEADKNGALQNPVITVNGTDAGTFTGTAATSNAGEAQLKREGNSYYWTLKAKLPTPVVPPAKPSDPANPSNPANPANPNNPVAPTTPVEPETVDIISKPVVGYVQQGYINRKMGLDQLGKLHERVGEQRNVGWENGNAINQVWGRLNLDYTALQGRSRFGADVKSGFVQFGRDIDFKLNDDKSQQHTGLTFTYGWANSKFFDKYKAENGVVVADKFTGSAKSDMLSIGGYHTYYSPTGAYVDLVGQVSWLQNRYRSGSTQVKQNGYGFGASIEVGKPYHLLNPQVTVEPQAQLSYQSIWLNGFNDGIRQVKKSRQDSLVGRLGVRVNWSETLDKNSPQVYFTANLIQTLAGKGSAITVGREQVKERFGDLAAEFGLGGQYPISQNLSFYADARYVIGIQDRNRVHRDSSLSRRSYHGRIGLRYSW